MQEKTFVWCPVISNFRANVDAFKFLACRCWIPIRKIPKSNDTKTLLLFQHASCHFDACMHARCRGHLDSSARVSAACVTADDSTCTRSALAMSHVQTLQTHLQMAGNLDVCKTVNRRNYCSRTLFTFSRRMHDCQLAWPLQVQTV